MEPKPLMSSPNLPNDYLPLCLRNISLPRSVLWRGLACNNMHAPHILGEKIDCMVPLHSMTISGEISVF